MGLTDLLCWRGTRSTSLTPYLNLWYRPEKPNNQKEMDVSLNNHVNDFNCHIGTTICFWLFGVPGKESAVWNLMTFGRSLNTNECGLHRICWESYGASVCFVRIPAQ